MSDVLQDTPIPVPIEEIEVLGVTHDSRKVRPGDLFVAVDGHSHDGRVFAADAMRRGAAGVVGRGSVPIDFDGVWLSVDEPRKWVAPLAAAAYGHPERRLTVVGVTGTNGKTTTVALLRSMLDAAGRKCAAIGTLGFSFGIESRPTELTTPEAGDLWSLFRQVVDGGGAAVAMEVSSHALDLHRVRGLEFDVAVFTNLSRDHLDYHLDFEDYFRAKRKLFDQVKSGGRAVVNVDDGFGKRLAALVDQPLTWGRRGDVRHVGAHLDEHGIRATIATPRGDLEIVSPLLGRYNLENLLAAVATAEALELPRRAIVEGIAVRNPVRGRMDPISREVPVSAFIDFAHTDRALAAALSSLAEFSGRKIILVFGCGGDRDRGKRRLMGQVAAEFADFAIATNDNPRSEDPDEILRQIEVGLCEGGAADYEVVPDRREAIRRAVQKADEGWTILVAGKGHEEVQILGDQRMLFSDREEVEHALEEKFGEGNAG